MIMENYMGYNKKTYAYKKNNILKNTQLLDSIIIFLFLFLHPTSFLIEYFIPIFQNNIFYSLFSLAMGLLVVLLFIKNFLFRRIKITNRIIFFICICSLIILLFIITYITSTPNESFTRSLKHMFLTFIPASLSAILLLNENFRKNFCENLLPIASIYFIFFAIFYVTNSNNISSIKDYEFSGLTYQTLSYYFMYLSSIFIMILIKKNSSVKKIVKCLLFIFIFSSIFIGLSIGGRGGFVYLLCFLLYLLILERKYILLLLKKIFTNQFLLFVFIVILIIVIFLSKSDVFKIGIDRIIQIFSNNTDDASMNGRYYLYSLARYFIKERPILGYGIGSVFSTCGIYTHHIFTDLLVETGIVGTSAIILLFIYIFYNYLKCKKKDYTISYIFILFLMGAIMCLFSGYYLNNTLFIFGISFFSLCKPNLKVDLLQNRRIL